MRKFLAVLPVVIMALSGTAKAQSGEIWISMGESILSNKDIGPTNLASVSPSDYQLDNGFRFGFRVAFNGSGHFGHEIQYAYNRSHFRIQGADAGGMAIHEGGYNFLGYLTPEGSKIRPFATGGVQFENFTFPGTSASSGQGINKYGFNYGAGVKVKVSSMFAVRLDLRQYASGKPNIFGNGINIASGMFRQTEATAGFGVVF